MSKLDETIASVECILDNLMAYREIMKLPDCNTCGIADKCMLKPEPGQMMRINCPHWRRGNNDKEL